MFEHKVEVNGSMLKGTIERSENNSDYVFVCKDIKYTEYASEMRALAAELNQVATELDRLNTKRKL